MGLTRALRRTLDIAVDLGTANTLVYVTGQGIVASEPSVVAIDQVTRDVYAVGLEAKQMIGRTPATISAVRPLRHGVIADFEVTEQMLRYFLGRVHRSRFAHPRLVLCAPSGITDVERRALVEASSAAGASAVALIEEPLAAAIGSDLPVAEPSATMIVDIGGGTSEVAVISMGGVVCLESVRVGGYDLDEAVALHLRTKHRLATGTETAEQLKIELGSAWPVFDERVVEVRGRDMASGLPSAVAISAGELREALAPTLNLIVAGDQAHPRGDPARTGRRHHEQRHQPRGRRLAARRPPRARHRGDGRGRGPRGGAVDLRRRRRRKIPRGLRDRPQGHAQLDERPAPRRHDADLTRNALAEEAVVAAHGIAHRHRRLLLEQHGRRDVTRREAAPRVRDR